jgi:hypothetical protein
MHVRLGNMPEGLVEREIKEFIQNEGSRELRIMERDSLHLTFGGEVITQSGGRLGGNHIRD